MQIVPVGIVGASGYSGLELSRILALHPHVELRLLGSDKWAGETAARRAGLPGAAGKLKYAPQARCAELGRESAAIFLATPAEASLELAPLLLGAGGRGIDPTGASLALAPLVELGVLDRGPLIVDAASGVTGAGRKAAEEYSFVEIDEDFRAYKVLRHQHQPEIAQTLDRPVTFTAHLLPIKRGILSTCYGQLAPGRRAAELDAALLHKYAESPFVEVLDSPDQITLKAVSGTNRCQVAVAADGDTVVAISAIDNLVKGAAGQAVQNLNLIMGWPPTAGLDALRGFHP